MKNLSLYIKEELAEDLLKGIGKDKLLPSFLTNHIEDVKGEFREWFEKNCEIEHSTLIDLASYVPRNIDIGEIDAAKWISHHLEDLLKTKPKKDAVKADDVSKDDKDEKNNFAPKDKSSKPIKEHLMLAGEEAQSAIFCHDPQDEEYYTIIWCANAKDKTWKQLVSEYKRLYERHKLDLFITADKPENDEK